MRFLTILLFPVLASAGMLPERLGDFNRTKLEDYRPPAAERDLYREYGFEAAERGQYAAGERKLEITAIRAKDSTGAFGIYEWIRPAASKPLADMGDRGAEAGESTYFQLGNYVVVLRGAKPEEDPLYQMLSVLPRYEHTAAPPLLKHMPAESMISNSERYVLGPVVLEKLLPSLPPSVVAFHLGTEARTAEYAVKGGRLRLVVFSYPTPHLARAQLEEFEKLPNVVAKRSGPLIAAIPNPFSADEAEKLLARVRYEATLTWQEHPASRRDNVADLILNILLLCGILAVFMMAAGVLVFGGRFLIHRFFPNSRLERAMDTDFIRLHLDER